MSQATLIQQVTLVNEGKIQVTDVLIQGERIQKIGSIPAQDQYQIVDGRGKYLLNCLAYLLMFLEKDLRRILEVKFSF